VRGRSRHRRQDTLPSVAFPALHCMVRAGPNDRTCTVNRHKTIQRNASHECYTTACMLAIALALQVLSVCSVVLRNTQLHTEIGHFQHRVFSQPASCSAKCESVLQLRTQTHNRGRGAKSPVVTQLRNFGQMLFGSTGLEHAHYVSDSAQPGSTPFAISVTLKDSPMASGMSVGPSKHLGLRTRVSTPPFIESTRELHCCSVGRPVYAGTEAERQKSSRAAGILRQSCG